ncbi:hypothetical protein LAZ67_15002720 [Cordylochernes scorpioides]|uniref:Uncharacterized protein n=1 Tax=Cordylochernes scorpioides TaxID=51811 RepID=A0ABY6LCD9_9ARAC|nr:hypothetical protein LAZ67_15002720 [Cordylochernes scorpioides]
MLSLLLFHPGLEPAKAELLFYFHAEIVYVDLGDNFAKYITNVEVQYSCPTTLFYLHAEIVYVDLDDNFPKYITNVENVSAYVIKTGSTTQWQADLVPKEMAATDMRNRRHVQPLLTWSTNAAHSVSLD